MPRKPITKKDTLKRRSVKKLTKIKKAVSLEPMIEEINIPSVTAPEVYSTRPPNKQFRLLVITMAVITGLVCAVYFLRSFYLAAWVNNRPIFRYQLNREMAKAVGADILENMIVQELVDQEADKSKVVVTADRLKQEIDKIKQTLSAGMTLEDALKFQGMTVADFEKQVATRIKINELLGKDVSVSAEEVDKFIKDNGSVLVATGAAEKRIEAEIGLRDQKISAKIQEWIKTLQEKARITRFLK